MPKINDSITAVCSDCGRSSLETPREFLLMTSGSRALPLTLLERSAQGHVTELHRDSPVSTRGASAPPHNPCLWGTKGGGGGDARGPPAGRTTSPHLSRAGLRFLTATLAGDRRLRGAPRLRRGAPAPRAHGPAGNPARAPEAAAARAVPEPPGAEGSEAAEPRPGARGGGKKSGTVPPSRAGREALESRPPARVAWADTRGPSPLAHSPPPPPRRLCRRLSLQSTNCRAPGRGAI